MPGGLRTARHCVFTGKVVEENSICWSGRTPSVKPCGFATSLSEGGSGETGSFAPEPEALPMLKGSLFEGAVAAGDWGSLPPNAKSPGGRPCSHAPGERVMDFYFLGFLIWNATAM